VSTIATVTPGVALDAAGTRAAFGVAAVLSVVAVGVSLLVRGRSQSIAER
jgi:hypothetical protein